MSDIMMSDMHCVNKEISQEEITPQFTILLQHRKITWKNHIQQYNWYNIINPETMKPEQERLVAVLKDTVSLLCKNSLTFEDQVQVQGVICITVDKQDVLVVPVHDSFGEAEWEPCVACGHAKDPPPEKQNSRKRNRRRRSRSGSLHPEEEQEEEEDEQQQRVKIKKEEGLEEDDGDDLILIEDDIKREPAYSNCDSMNSSYISGYMDNSQLTSITATEQSQNMSLNRQLQYSSGPLPNTPGRSPEGMPPASSDRPTQMHPWAILVVNFAFNPVTLNLVNGSIHLHDG
ncbi:hypothetical protein CAPTEDRAFT_199592 [Capitella teleta]|uniref:Uncharacterized protein n=1 Tax=Capitella teleta TaxID=283909 RepID=R7TJ28_CAPTE|nr:hypothetical protein CAPTEDRAFT_199592 [Capitella teleta]|eukprot:ELT91556.1 hypothetical protein CAPTEDRAFT_199592 [Capitella teleta]